MNDMSELSNDAMPTDTTPAVADQTPETEDQGLGDAFDRATGSGEQLRDESGRFAKNNEPAPQVEGADDDVTKEGVAADQASQRPQYFDSLPAELRDAWDDVPEGVRTSLAESHHRMNQQSMQAGRTLKALGPIHDRMAQAVQEFPELSNMTPDQVAADAMELTKTRVQLQRDPVGTLIAVAQQTGALAGLMERLTGQEAPQPQAGPEIMAELKFLREQVNTLSNPDIIRGSVQQFANEQQVANEVQNWAADKPHYQTVEPHLPSFIQAAMNTMPQASPTDLLDAAYSMATNALGLSAPDPQPAPPAPAPDKTKRILDAKSVNKASRGTKPTPLTEDEEMAAAFDRITGR